MIELVGVVSIMAILITLLIPRIYGVINESRITHVVMSYRSMMAGVHAHYGRWGGFRHVDGTAYAANEYPVEDFDRVLFEGGYINEPFILPIGNGRSGNDGNAAMDPATDGTRLRLLSIANVREGDPVTAGDTDMSGTYRLSPLNAAPAGTSAGSRETAGVDVTGSYLVEAVIPGVAIRDAQELNKRIDGRNELLGAREWGDGSGNTTEADYTGKVKWERGFGSEATVFIYIAHY